ncbi:MAG: hypothetical protein N3H84_00435 [Candidatus Caldarchaeum sp.]|nr:hypothetical protein [Candidatus Caldarchaeum sp.]
MMYYDGELTLREAVRALPEKVAYVLALNLLRKIWVNFELVWLVTLASVAAIS